MLHPDGEKKPLVHSLGEFVGYPPPLTLESLSRVIRRNLDEGYIEEPEKQTENLPVSSSNQTCYPVHLRQQDYADLSKYLTEIERLSKTVSREHFPATVAMLKMCYQMLQMAHHSTENGEEFYMRLLLDNLALLALEMKQHPQTKKSY